MTDDPGEVVSPADARILPGSFTDTPYLCIKEKLFRYEELTGMDRPWHSKFRDGNMRFPPDPGQVSLHPYPRVRQG